jgi:osmotically-inducible protein OsmY
MMNRSKAGHRHMRDMHVLKHLRSLIGDDGRIPRLDVDVDVENGVVELLGVIPDQREHDALLALVAFAARSAPVVDHLIVTRRSPPRRRKAR